MLKIRFRKNISFLYMFLFAGVFNDIIRLGSSQITLFRLLLPFALVVTIIHSKKAQKAYLIFLALAIVSLIQSLIFCSLNDAGVTFNFIRYTTYLFYYFCIVTSICAVIVVYELDPYGFYYSFEKFLVVCGCSYLLVFAIIYHIHNARAYLNINNQNDYGAMLTMLMPLFYYRYLNNKKVIGLLYIPIAIAYLVLNDCKLAFLGALFQIVLIVYISVRYSKGRYILTVPTVLLFVFSIYYLSNKNLSLNGYDWINTVVEPIKAMIKGELYEHSNTSLTFRVNTFIVCTRWMFKTMFLGIGIGNSGVLVRNVLGNNYLYAKWMINDAVSIHNAFLEIILEFGIIAIVGIVLFIKKVGKVMKSTNLLHFESCFIVISVSSLLWLQGPSGILVDYLVFITFAYYLIGVNHWDLREKGELLS